MPFNCGLTNLSNGIITVDNEPVLLLWPNASVTSEIMFAIFLEKSVMPFNCGLTNLSNDVIAVDSVDS